MNTRSNGLRSILLAIGYAGGLLFAAFGVWVVLDARSAPTTDVGAITSGVEALVGICALMLGVMLLGLSGAAEYSARKRRVAPEPEGIRRADGPKHPTRSRKDADD